MSRLVIGSVIGACVGLCLSILSATPVVKPVVAKQKCERLMKVDFKSVNLLKEIHVRLRQLGILHEHVRVLRSLVYFSELMVNTVDLDTFTIAYGQCERCLFYFTTISTDDVQFNTLTSQLKARLKSLMTKLHAFYR